MKKDKAIARISMFIPVKEKQIVEKTISIESISFANVRDRMIGLGKILEESFDEHYYIANVSSGVANKNSAVVLVHWNENELYLCGYAKEGLINQHTAEKAIDKVIEKVTK